MIDELFQAVRAAASTKAWSDGVALARKDVVTGDRESDDEIVLRVLDPDKGLSATVTFFPADEDWHCDWSAHEDPNHYVVAAVIALKRAREKGQALPRSRSSAAHISYELVPEGRDLAFERWIVDGDKRSQLMGALSSYTSQRVSGPAFSATSLDMDIEWALGAERRGVLSAKTWRKVLPKLRDVPHLSANGQPLRVSLEPRGLTVTVRDEGPAIRVEPQRDPDVTHVFRNGVALAGDVLHPTPDAPQQADVATLLAKGHTFGRQEWGRLAAEILPALAPHAQVVVTSTQLPRADAGEARLEVAADVAGATLRVTPRIVYGDPAVAYVADGELVSLDRARVPTRKRDRERVLRDELSRQLGLEAGRTVHVAGAEAVALARKLKAWRGDVRGAGLSAFAADAPLEPRVAFPAGGISLRFETGAENGGREAKAQDVLGAWRRGEALVPLIGGGLAPLPSTWLARHGEALRELLALKEESSGALPMAGQALAARLARDLGEAEPPAFRVARERWESLAEPGAWRPPADLRADLRPYQAEGAAWLARVRDLGMGALLADDMGLGKTLQTIAVLEGPALVVAPTSVLYNWRKEIARFRPTLKTQIYHGPQRRLDASADVVLTTYGVLRQDKDTLAARSWRVAVLDEAQNIKNPDSQVSRAAFALRAEARIALSGTPVENRLDDLWSQMRFLNPGLLGTATTFRERFASGAPDALSALRQRITPVFLRRLKKDVAKDLPPKTETVLWAELEGEEKASYEALRTLAVKDVRERIAGSASTFELLELLLRLRQAANHLALVPGMRADGSSKLATLVETLRDILAEDHKAIIVSQWTAFLDLIQDALARESWPTLRLDGATRDRQAVVDRFQGDPESRLLLLSLKAGGVGLNLTAADHVIIMDPWWNPAAEEQAADRAYRIGQDRPVFVHRLIAKDTVEERILALQDAKRALAAGVAGETASVPALTKDDIIALLAD